MLLASDEEYKTKWNTNAYFPGEWPRICRVTETVRKVYMIHALTKD